MGSGATCSLLTSCPPPALHLMGAGLKPKKNLFPAFGFFFLLFFFSKRSYFLQWFYTEGKTQPKKKSLYLNPKSFPFFPVSALKPKGCFSQEPRERTAFIESSFCPAALALRSSQDPVTWCLRGRCGVLFTSFLQTAGPVPCRLQRSGVQRGWPRGQAPPGSTTLG